MQLCERLWWVPLSASVPGQLMAQLDLGPSRGRSRERVSGPSDEAFDMCVTFVKS
jgi:hypothetical protein